MVSEGRLNAHLAQSERTASEGREQTAARQQEIFNRHQRLAQYEARAAEAIARQQEQ